MAHVIFTLEDETTVLDVALLHTVPRVGETVEILTTKVERLVVKQVIHKMCVNGTTPGHQPVCVLLSKPDGA